MDQGNVSSWSKSVIFSLVQCSLIYLSHKEDRFVVATLKAQKRGRRNVLKKTLILP
jgi:hypothetical protein